MPTNTNVVMIIVAFTWSNSVDSDAASPPHQLSLKVPALKYTPTSTMNTTIGTILAIVTIRLIVVASLTPRAMSQWKVQIATDDSATARSVSPSPSAGKSRPIVVMMNT